MAAWMADCAIALLDCTLPAQGREGAWAVAWKADHAIALLDALLKKPDAMRWEGLECLEACDAHASAVRRMMGRTGPPLDARTMLTALVVRNALLEPLRSVPPVMVAFPRTIAELLQRLKPQSGRGAWTAWLRQREDHARRAARIAFLRASGVTATAALDRVAATECVSVEAIRKAWSTRRALGLA